MDRCEKKFRNKGEKDFLINFAFVVIYNMSMYRGCECHSHGLQCVKVSGLLDPAPTGLPEQFCTSLSNSAFRDITLAA